MVGGVSGTPCSSLPLLPRESKGRLGRPQHPGLSGRRDRRSDGGMRQSVIISLQLAAICRRMMSSPATPGGSGASGMTWAARLVKLSVCVAIAATAATRPAAADAGVPPILAKIIASPEHQKAVIQAAQQGSAWLNNRCGGGACAPPRAVAAVPPTLAKIIASPEHQKAVIQAAQQGSAWLNNRCGGATFAIASDVAVYQGLELDAQARPTAGAWRERVMAIGCGTSRTLNVLTFVKSPGSLVSGTLLPGTTRADPLLQRDAYRYAALAAAAPASCSQTYIANTAFAGIEGAANASLPPEWRSPPWKEEWTVAACDKRE